jgi:hypothetical protein
VGGNGTLLFAPLQRARVRTDIKAVTTHLHLSERALPSPQTPCNMHHPPPVAAMKSKRVLWVRIERRVDASGRAEGRKGHRRPQVRRGRAQGHVCGTQQAVDVYRRGVAGKGGTGEGAFCGQKRASVQEEIGDDDKRPEVRIVGQDVVPDLNELVYETFKVALCGDFGSGKQPATLSHSRQQQIANAQPCPPASQSAVTRENHSFRGWHAGMRHACAGMRPYSQWRGLLCGGMRHWPHEAVGQSTKLLSWLAGPLVTEKGRPRGQIRGFGT